MLVSYKELQHTFGLQKHSQRVICALSRSSHCHWSPEGTATRALFCGQTKINRFDILKELKNKIYAQILKRLVNIRLVLCFYWSTFYKHRHRTKKYCSYWKALWETWSCKYFGTCLTVMWPFWHRLRGTSPNCLPQRPVVNTCDESLKTGQVKWYFSHILSHQQAVFFRDLLILLLF